MRDRRGIAAFLNDAYIPIPKVTDGITRAGTWVAFLATFGGGFWSPWSFTASAYILAWSFLAAGVRLQKRWDGMTAASLSCEPVAWWTPSVSPVNGGPAVVEDVVYVGLLVTNHGLAQTVNGQVVKAENTDDTLWTPCWQHTGNAYESLGQGQEKRLLLFEVVPGPDGRPRAQAFRPDLADGAYQLHSRTLVIDTKGTMRATVRVWGEHGFGYVEIELEFGISPSGAPVAVVVRGPERVVKPK